MNFIILRLKKALKITKFSLLSIALLTMQQTIYSHDDSAQWPQRSNGEFIYNKITTRDKVEHSQDREDIETTPTIEITQHLFDYGITRTKTTKAHKYHHIVQTTIETWTTKNPVSHVWNNGTLILGISGTTALMYIKQQSEIQDSVFNESDYLEEEIARLADEGKMQITDINRLQNELNDAQAELAVTEENNNAAAQDQAQENAQESTDTTDSSDQTTTEESNADDDSSDESSAPVVTPVTPSVVAPAPIAAPIIIPAPVEQAPKVETAPVVIAPVATPTPIAAPAMTPATTHAPAVPVVTPVQAEQTPKVEPVPATTPAPVAAPAIIPAVTPVPAVTVPVVTPAPVPAVAEKAPEAVVASPAA